VTGRHDRVAMFPGGEDRTRIREHCHLRLRNAAPVTPRERQAMGRRAVQHFEAGAWLGAEQSGDGAASGMRRDVAV
jgi:hypothetical protein